MSRWLASVNNLLDQIDDNIDQKHEDELWEEGDEVHELVSDDSVVASNNNSLINANSVNHNIHDTNVRNSNDIDVDEDVKETGAVGEEQDVQNNYNVTSQETDDNDRLSNNNNDNTSVSSHERIDTLDDKKSPLDEGIEGKTPLIIEKRPPRKEPTKSETTSSIHSSSDTFIAPIKSINPSLKPTLSSTNSAIISNTHDVNGLRRQLALVKRELKEASLEIEAQREELEQAAQQMALNKKNHNDQISALKIEYEGRIHEMDEDFKVQLKEMNQKIAEVAVEKSNHALLEDEKDVLESQVASLKIQVGSLESQLDSALMSIETSKKREEDAESRLDTALALHARQSSQRQQRETELEAKISDLSGTLIKLQEQQSSQKIESDGDNLLRNAVHEQELQSVRNHSESIENDLRVEREANGHLKREIATLLQERTAESATAMARQRQYDNQISQLRQHVSTMEKELKEEKRLHSALLREKRNSNETEETEILKSKVASLSEQIVRQQSKIEITSSETSTLKNRLTAAEQRAEAAENALLENNQTFDNYDYDMEYGRIRNGAHLRRRSKDQSIRQALKLPTTSLDDKTEALGSALDAIDSFSAQVGTLLRYNPLARGGFILYILLLHLWALCLLVFHVHSYEPEHGDFGGSTVVIPGQTKN